MVRNSGLGHYYICLTRSDDIFTARSSDLEMNEVCGTKSKEQPAKANCSSPRGNWRKYNVAYIIDGKFSFIQ
ncbi:hypothetical protein CN984_06095 [Bacillus cereus]|uniref:Uncharacterized protein n=1 Tax=Bacillus cereus TaxID=1396 RepID=A0A2B9QC35_BACCE|nr:hypothetical protein CN984_06095 [Bacillus cereus]